MKHSWRDDSVAETARCSSKGPRLDFLHSHDILQLSVIPILEDWPLRRLHIGDVLMRDLQTNTRGIGIFFHPERQVKLAWYSALYNIMGSYM